MSATHTTDSTMATAPVLYLALELSWTSWKLAFTVGAGPKPRLRSIAARDTNALHARDPQGQASLRTARRDSRHLLLRSRPRRLLARSLPPSTTALENLIVDAASIEVNRRKAPGQIGQPRRHKARG